MNPGTNNQARLIIPHEDGEIIFAYPSIGGFYREVGRGILEKGYKIPTGEEIASLIRSVYPPYTFIKDHVRIWVFNRNLSTYNGVYVLQDQEANGTIFSGEYVSSQAHRQHKINLINKVNKLEKIVKNGEEIEGVRFSEDGRIRFAPRETYVSKDKIPLSKNGFVIASFGLEGARKLEEASHNFKDGYEVGTLDLKDEIMVVDDVSYISRYNHDHLYGVTGGNPLEHVLCIEGREPGDDLCGSSFGIIK
ncbi:hypothetical protein J4221_00125 [Candidatus Pacearchaeota archaeon]|nr:hypothetical protein [Candidatus Pacearchaeota archaeon]